MAHPQMLTAPYCQYFTSSYEVPNDAQEAAKRRYDPGGQNAHHRHPSYLQLKIERRKKQLAIRIAEPMQSYTTF